MRRDERDAVRTKSGNRVDHSLPELTVGPTLSATAGRKPEARPACSAAPAADCQRKSGREPEGRALGGREAAEVLDADSLRLLTGFFELLDQWDAETANDDEAL